MGGEITAKSKLGVGTTFTVSLPITNDAAFIDIPTPHISEAHIDVSASNKTNMVLTQEASATNHDKSKPLLLIVEDNADVIHYLIQCLKSDYKIEIALNGEEGIEKAIEQVPDVILSDVMMPIKDGLELCQTVKTDLRTSHIPVILLTAKADIASRLEGISRGADAYLSKPFHEEELLLILSNQLALRRKLQKRYSLSAPDQDEVSLQDQLAL